MLKKIIIIIVSMFLIILGGTTVYFVFKERNVIVFAYHKIVPQAIKEKYFADNPWVSTTESFEEQMKYLYDNKYQILSMDEYDEWKKGKRKISLKTAMITIDDGDIETYYEILPVLKKYGFSATYFMIGENIRSDSLEYRPEDKQYLTMDLIKKIADEYPLLEIQSHSYGLHNIDDKKKPYVFLLSKEDLNKDFAKMDEISNELGVKIDIFCYPYGGYNDNIIELLKEKKYRMAFRLDKSEISKKDDDRYLIPRVSISGETTYVRFKHWCLKAILF